MWSKIVGRGSARAALGQLAAGGQLRRYGAGMPGTQNLVAQGLPPSESSTLGELIAGATESPVKDLPCDSCGQPWFSRRGDEAATAW